MESTEIMKSKSHHDIHTGILDMNGVPILKNSKIRVHDNYRRTQKEKIGKVKWKQGSYVFEGEGANGYNIYAWRKNIEVLDSYYPTKFDEDEFEELCDKFERREFGVLTPIEHRKIFRKAFRLGWESRIEIEHFNEHK